MNDTQSRSGQELPSFDGDDLESESGERQRDGTSVDPKTSAKQPLPPWQHLKTAPQDVVEAADQRLIGSASHHEELDTSDDSSSVPVPDLSASLNARSPVAKQISKTSAQDVAEINSQGCSSSESDASDDSSSISESELSAILNERNDLAKHIIGLSCMPGHYRPDNLTSNWVILFLAACFMLLSIQISLLAGNTFTLSATRMLSLGSTAATAAPSLMPSTPEHPEPRLLACQQICGRPNGSWHATGRRQPRDWLYEASLSLDSLDRLHKAPSRHDHNESSFNNPYDLSSLNQLILTCQDKLQNLWDATDIFRAKMQCLATDLNENHLDQPPLAFISFREILTTTSGIHHLTILLFDPTQSKRQHRNSAQLETSLSLSKALHRIPIPNLHARIKSARACTERIIETSPEHLLDTSQQLAISVRMALDRFAWLFKHTLADLDAVSLALDRHANATACLDVEAPRALDPARRILDALVASW